MQILKTIFTFLFALALAGTFRPATAQVYTITDLGTLPGTDKSTALGINAAGQVVGTSHMSGHYHPFLWDGGAMSSLSAGEGFAQAVNAAGQIALSGFGHAA